MVQAFSITDAGLGSTPLAGLGGPSKPLPAPSVFESLLEATLVALRTPAASTQGGSGTEGSPSVDAADGAAQMGQDKEEKNKAREAQPIASSPGVPLAQPAADIPQMGEVTEQVGVLGSEGEGGAGLIVLLGVAQQQPADGSAEVGQGPSLPSEARVVPSGWQTGLQGGGEMSIPGKRGGATPVTGLEQVASAPGLEAQTEGHPASLATGTTLPGEGHAVDGISLPSTVESFIRGPLRPLALGFDYVPVQPANWEVERGVIGNTPGEAAPESLHPAVAVGSTRGSGPLGGTPLAEAVSPGSGASQASPSQLGVKAVVSQTFPLRATGTAVSTRGSGPLGGTPPAEAASSGSGVSQALAAQLDAKAVVSQTFPLRATGAVGSTRSSDPLGGTTPLAETASPGSGASQAPAAQLDVKAVVSPTSLQVEGTPSGQGPTYHVQPWGSPTVASMVLKEGKDGRGDIEGARLVQREISGEGQGQVSLPKAVHQAYVAHGSSERSKDFQSPAVAASEPKTLKDAASSSSMAVYSQSQGPIPPATETLSRGAGLVEPGVGAGHPDATPVEGYGDAAKAQGRTSVSQLAQEVKKLVVSGGGEAKIHMEPASLGSIEMRVRYSEGRVSLSMAVETQDARYAIQSELPALRSALEERGFVLDRFTVTGGLSSGLSGSWGDGRQGLREDHRELAGDTHQWRVEPRKEEIDPPRTWRWAPSSALSIDYRV